MIFDKRMTVAEAATHYGKHYNTIYKWIVDGGLIAKKDPGGQCWWVLGEADSPLEITDYRDE